jgi:uncharacterized protein
VFERRQFRGPGVVKAYTVVHRDAPGVEVPFVSVLVEMSEGLVVKGNLVASDPRAIDPSLLDTEVTLITNTLRPDKNGTVAVAFAFSPASGSEMARGERS